MTILTGEQTATERTGPAAAPPLLDAAAARRRLLLEGAILSTILRLASPVVIGFFAQMSASLIQLHFVGLLGVDALAGVTLVFPCLTLMQLVATAGIGPGVSSAVARKLGAGHRADAEALVLNAVVMAIVIGSVFAGAALLFGERLYRLIGGSGAVLADSVAYSDWILGASILVWTVNLLVSALIGCGNTRVPQMVSLFALVVAPLSPALMFGWGPLPPMGIIGGGVAYVVYYVVATVALIVYLRSGRTTLRLPLDLRLIEWRLMRDILQVGGLASLSAMIPAFTVLLVTAAVARFGIDAVAGYGIAVRAEYLLLPLYYGICAGVLPMVGMNVGAGQIPRARSIAWTGALLAAAIGGAAALLLVLAPHAWVGLFNKEPAVIAAGSLYFRIVAIQYPLTALAIVLAAAAQGAGHPLWPFAGGAARLIIAGAGGWLVVAGLGGSISTLFAMLAIAGVLYCVIITAGQLSDRSIPDRS